MNLVYYGDHDQAWMKAWINLNQFKPVFYNIRGYQTLSVALYLPSKTFDFSRPSVTSVNKHSIILGITFWTSKCF